MGPNMKGGSGSGKGWDEGSGSGKGWGGGKSSGTKGTGGKGDVSMVAQARSAGSACSDS